MVPSSVCTITFSPMLPMPPLCLPMLLRVACSARRFSCAYGVSVYCALCSMRYVCLSQPGRGRTPLVTSRPRNTVHTAPVNINHSPWAHGAASCNVWDHPLGWMWLGQRPVLMPWWVHWPLPDMANDHASEPHGGADWAVLLRTKHSPNNHLYKPSGGADRALPRCGARCDLHHVSVPLRLVSPAPGMDDLSCHCLHPRWGILPEGREGE